MNFLWDHLLLPPMVYLKLTSSISWSWRILWVKSSYAERLMWEFLGIESVECSFLEFLCFLPKISFIIELNSSSFSNKFIGVMRLRGKKWEPDFVVWFLNLYKENQSPYINESGRNFMNSLKNAEQRVYSFNKFLNGNLMLYNLYIVCMQYTFNACSWLNETEKKQRK